MADDKQYVTMYEASKLSRYDQAKLAVDCLADKACTNEARELALLLLKTFIENEGAH